ncbi:MAG: single-stranded-DNA-specific exonuclease RecJ [Verrucomicrobiota bacterium]
MSTGMRWILPEAADASEVARLVNDARIAPWAAGILVRRGLSEPDVAARFLKPLLRTLSDPFLLPEMDAATARILAAVEKRERIVLYGDYDVDGVTSLTLLTRLLRAYGAEVATFLPHRVDEGYGLSADGVARCVEEHRPQLLIAVDCGTTSVAEISHLRESGVDVIVLDHHEPKDELPPAVAIVNPKVRKEDSGSDAGHSSSVIRHSPFDYLCSAGLAFKVAHALLKRRPLPGFDIKDLLDLAAIGTVADVVPLVEENRIFVRAGLDRIPQSRWPGVRALVEVAGLRTPLRAVDIGFGIGPRLNAAGRLDSATAALELLLTDDPARAQSLARSLDQQNRERRAIEDEVLGKAGAQIIGAYDPAGDAAIVVGDAGWHPGVVGIVASRLLRRYHRPTFVIGFDAMGIGKGSGRSIEGFSLVAALARCAPLLEKFGGHEMAAGVTMRQENFAAFRETFAQAAREMIAPENLQRALRLDAELRLAEVNLNLLDEHDALQPFGTANHQPVFFTRGVTLSGEPRMMKDKHWSFNFRHARAEGGAIRAQCRGVWWNAAEEILPPLPWDIAYTVSRNEWNGRVDAQLELRGVRAAAM